MHVPNVDQLFRGVYLAQIYLRNSVTKVTCCHESRLMFPVLVMGLPVAGLRSEQRFEFRNRTTV